jgi:hypothetical protein
MFSTSPWSTHLTSHRCYLDDGSGYSFSHPAIFTSDPSLVWSYLAYQNLHQLSSRNGGRGRLCARNTLSRFDSDSELAESGQLRLPGLVWNLGCPVRSRDTSLTFPKVHMNSPSFCYGVKLLSMLMFRLEIQLSPKQGDPFQHTRSHRIR